MLRRILTCLSQIAPKFLIWSLVVSILTASLPIPIAVVSTSSEDSSIPYPCQHGKCGCKSALQCWTNCCCNTPQQRLDWAAAKGVAVPEYGQHLKQVIATEKAKATRPACCKKTAMAGEPDLLNKKEKPTCCSAHTKPGSVASKPRTKIVLSMLALGCRGSVGELASLPWAIVQLPAIYCGPLLPLEGELILADAQASSQFYPPELPPPKVS